MSDTKEKNMEEIAGKGMDFVRGMSQQHGPVVALLFVTLAMVFLLTGFLGWYVGGGLKTSVDNVAVSVTAMMRVVDRVGIQCVEQARYAPNPNFAPYPRTRNPRPTYDESQDNR